MAVKLEDGGRLVTCPGCDTTLRLPPDWVLRYEPSPKKCAVCGTTTLDEEGDVCQHCQDRAEYRASGEYRAVRERRNALQESDAISTIDAHSGNASAAARTLGVVDQSEHEPRWFYAWLRRRGLMPAVYEIRKRHGWTGEPPTVRTRKRPRPVLAFKR